MPGNAHRRAHVLRSGPGRRFTTAEYQARTRKPIRAQRMGVDYWFKVMWKHKALLRRPVSLTPPRPARERIDPAVGAEVYRRCLDMVWFYTWGMPDAYARERWESQLERFRRYAK